MIISSAHISCLSESDNSKKEHAVILLKPVFLLSEHDVENSNMRRSTTTTALGVFHQQTGETVQSGKNRKRLQPLSPHCSGLRPWKD